MLNLPPQPVEDNTQPLPAEKIRGGVQGWMDQLSQLADFMSRPSVAATAGAINPIGGMGVITGPGRAQMQKMVPPRLFKYLDRSSFEFPVATEGAAPGTRGTYWPGMPATEQGVLGEITMAPHSADDPITWTHEGMHAAKDLTRMNRILRAPSDPVARRLGDIQPRGLLTDVPDKQGVTGVDKVHAKAIEAPWMQDYADNYALYRPDKPPGYIQQETVNEWQALNALKKHRWPGEGDVVDAIYPPKGSTFDRLLQYLNAGGAAMGLSGDSPDLFADEKQPIGSMK